MPYEKMFENTFIIRLMILYSMREYNKPLTNPELTKYVTEYNEINFFDLQYNIYELVKMGELYGFKENEVYYYRLTDEGRESIEFFENKIPLVIKNRLRKSVATQLEKEKPVTDIVADFMPEKNEFLASVKILENGVEQFGVNILVPKRENAIAVCEYFKHNVGDIYKYVNKNINEIV